MPAIAETALALGIEDPMNLTSEQVDQVEQYLSEHRDQFRSLWRSDADLVNLFKSNEIALSDGGPGLAERIRNTGVDARWVAPRERPLSWVCGLSVTSDAENIDAAYKLINWQASPEAQAIRADDGYVVTNPRPFRSQTRKRGRRPTRSRSRMRSRRPSRPTTRSGSGRSGSSRQSEKES